MRKHYLLATFVILAGFVLIGASCTTKQTTSPEPTTTNSQVADRTINISGENYSFSLEEIKIKKGDRVKIVFTSKQDFHDLVIDEFNVATQQIRAGETSSIEFTADKVGSFEYYCSVGNHRQLGMVGKLIAENNDKVTNNNSAEEINYDYSGNLTDVTGGKTVGSINTENKASGIAKANFKNNTYSLIANFNDLPDPPGTDFYEGWVVRQNPLNVISTGKAEKNNGQYVNTFTANRDLTDHDFYVLTIEPDNGNPEPAEHVLEGVIQKQ